jgi:hypothetical protein
LALLLPHKGNRGGDGHIAPRLSAEAAGHDMRTGRPKNRPRSRGTPITRAGRIAAIAFVFQTTKTPLPAAAQMLDWSHAQLRRRLPAKKYASSSSWSTGKAAAGADKAFSTSDGQAADKTTVNASTYKVPS